MSNVTRFNAERAERASDNSLWTPVDCLQDCIEQIEDGKIKVDRLLILRLNTEGGEEFNVGYNACNINGSTALALLEVAKTVILADMGYIPKRSDDDV